jgi:hypothetical protein
VKNAGAVDGVTFPVRSIIGEEGARSTRVSAGAGTGSAAAEADGRTEGADRDRASGSSATTGSGGASGLDCGGSITAVVEAMAAGAGVVPTGAGGSTLVRTGVGPAAGVRRTPAGSRTAVVMSLGAVMVSPHFGHGADTPAKWVGTRSFASQCGQVNLSFFTSFRLWLVQH